MIHLYTTNICELPDPIVYPEIMTGLQEERQEKILRCKQERNRKQSLAAGLLLCKVLERYNVSQEQITVGENGKPQAPGIHFNLSHSDEMVICAVGEKAVGCDVEKIKTMPEKVAERFFCESEKKHLGGFEAEQLEQEFFRLWTMKESYMKMTGEGMKLPLSQFEIVFGNQVRVKRDEVIQPCYFKEYKVPGYKVTVCSEDTEFAPDMKYIKLR